MRKLNSEREKLGMPRIEDQKIFKTPIVEFPYKKDEKITQKDLIYLGFKKINVKDDGEKFFYYCYEFGKGMPSLITDETSDQVTDDVWSVVMFDYDNMIINKSSDLEKFIKLVNSFKIK